MSSSSKLINLSHPFILFDNVFLNYFYCFTYNRRSSISTFINLFNRISTYCYPTIASLLIICWLLAVAIIIFVRVLFYLASNSSFLYIIQRSPNQIKRGPCRCDKRDVGRIFFYYCRYMTLFLSGLEKPVRYYCQNKHMYVQCNRPWLDQIIKNA